jgi:hypothetical protein
LDLVLCRSAVSFAAFICGKLRINGQLEFPQKKQGTRASITNNEGKKKKKMGQKEGTEVCGLICPTTVLLHSFDLCLSFRSPVIDHHIITTYHHRRR